MLPDLLSTIIALALVCSAVLDASILETHGAILAVCGIAMAALGFWANRVDYLKWAGLTVIGAGAAILILFVSGLSAASPESAFWVVFWAGNIAGLVSLWSALYRGPRELPGSMDA
jgi:amino acid permease